MAQYIDKATVVAEIERRIVSLEGIGSESYLHDNYPEQYAMLVTLKSLKFSLDTLEVKDVDEIIKNAEDHAYFAGSENTREKLIDKACKWWEVELTYPSMTPEEFKWYKNKVRKFRKDMEDK